MINLNQYRLVEYLIEVLEASTNSNHTEERAALLPKLRLAKKLLQHREDFKALMTTAANEGMLVESEVGWINDEITGKRWGLQIDVEGLMFKGEL